MYQQVYSTPTEYKFNMQHIDFGIIELTCLYRLVVLFFAHLRGAAQQTFSPIAFNYVFISFFLLDKVKNSVKFPPRKKLPRFQFQHILTLEIGSTQFILT